MPRRARRGSERLRYLLVDEYQDTNDAQYRLLKHLAGARGAFTCVGDDDQSHLRLARRQSGEPRPAGRDYPKLKVIKLEQNYRCARRILRAANALIANNPHLHVKKLWSELPDGPPIRVLECHDDEHEAERIAADRRAPGHQAQGALERVRRSCIAATTSRARWRRRCAWRSVPYHLTGALAFLDRAEVKDVLCLPAPGRQPLRRRRVPARGQLPRREIGATTLEKLGTLAQSRHVSMLEAARSDAALKALAPRPASALAGFVRLIDGLRQQAAARQAADLVEAVLERTGYAEHLAAQIPEAGTRERRLGNLRELVDWFRAMGRDGGRAGDLAAQLALLTHADRDDPGNALRMMTLHAAKGLEFRFVFIVGCEDGTLPHEGAHGRGPRG